MVPSLMTLRFVYMTALDQATRGKKEETPQSLKYVRGINVVSYYEKQCAFLLSTEVRCENHDVDTQWWQRRPEQLGDWYTPGRR